jgi:hypothetical protein
MLALFDGIEIFAQYGIAGIAIAALIYIIVKFQKQLTEKDVNPEELAMGIEVEMEHLNPESPYAEDMAKRIAPDFQMPHFKYSANLPASFNLAALAGKDDMYII